MLALLGVLRPPASGSTSGAAEVGDATSSPAQSGTPPAQASAALDASPTATIRATPSSSRRGPTPAPKPVACKPTDQDRYVYNPDRLAVQAACIRVTGTVEAVRKEADGDLHILVALDPVYTHLLTPANRGEELGDLVVEPVCVRSVTQVDAEGTCAADPDPLMGPFPAIGAKIWMEGRYVFDLDHGGWAELHPLYRWNYR